MKVLSEKNDIDTLCIDCVVFLCHIHY